MFIFLLELHNKKSIMCRNGARTTGGREAVGRAFEFINNSFALKNQSTKFSQEIINELNG